MTLADCLCNLSEDLSLQDVPFGELIQQRQQGNISKSHFAGQSEKQSYLHSRPARQKDAAAAGSAKGRFKRENKNRPTEQSSKRPVPRFREVMESQKRCGKLPQACVTFNTGDRLARIWALTATLTCEALR